jgi:hypothetical protein
LKRATRLAKNRLHLSGGTESPWDPGIDWRLHLLIALQVFAGLWAWLENGALIRAAEDSLAGLLADATVADVQRLAALKWFTRGLGLARIPGRGGRTFAAGHRATANAISPVGIALAALAGLLLAGSVFGFPQWRGYGLAVLLVALPSSRTAFTIWTQVVARIPPKST